MSPMRVIVSFFFFFVFILLGALFGSHFLLARQNSTQTSAYQPSTLDTNANTATTQLAVAAAKNSTQTQVSPDGIMLLTLEETSNANETEYSIFVQKEAEARHMVYQGAVAPQTTIKIPFNTWSPDNKYFFITQTTGEAQRFLLFKATGELFEDRPFINVSALFEQSVTSYKIHDITGWGTRTALLVQTTDPQNNTVGPSFWFEAGTQKFIQLSTLF